MRIFRTRRRAVSEVVGTVLTAAMTIIAGAAIFGFVNGQAGISAQAYGNNVAGSINYLNEKFAVVDLTFGTSSVTIWIYNNGRVGLDLLQIRLYDSSSAQINFLFNYTVSGSTRTDYFYDLRSSLSTKCKTSATSPTNYEPQGTVSAFSDSIGLTKVIQVSFPTTTNANCPSYGQSFTTGTAYAVTTVGANGDSITYYQVK